MAGKWYSRPIQRGINCNNLEEPDKTYERFISELLCGPLSNKGTLK